MTPLPPRLDHLVVLATDLEQGVGWAEATLGVTPEPGGEHPLMGTHNRLLRIVHPEVPAWQRSYLEIIAINPRANNDQRTLACRWFDMDSAVYSKDIGEDGVVKVDGLTKDSHIIAIDKHGNESKVVKVK